MGEVFDGVSEGVIASDQIVRERKQEEGRGAQIGIESYRLPTVASSAVVMFLPMKRMAAAQHRLNITPTSPPPWFEELESNSRLFLEESKAV